jgi:DNA polymerase I-like protein with 3'-5' exonuclease and polymerase domains
VHGAVAKELGITRHAAKTVNFLIIYGGGANKLAETLKITRGKAYEIIQNYKSRYPGVFDVMEKAQNVAEEKGRVKYWSGRWRHFKYPSEARKAFNSIIQGGAFEIVKDGMLRLDAAGYTIVNQVHDSVWVQVPSNIVGVAVPQIQDILSAGTKETFGVTFSTDAKRLN